MILMKANEVDTNELTSFFENNEAIDKEAVKKEGYIVTNNNHIIGCFILKRIEQNNFWLKQLFITKAEANTLPTLLQLILQLAKAKAAHEVYVHSHQLMVDLLLQSLQFHPQERSELLKSLPRQKGIWWSYKISS
ncbi:MAG TPA: hypothetical protein VK061_08250 [Bacillota bacterium]|nr:hypothetical protein [Bacillota bacterium]